MARCFKGIPRSFIVSYTLVCIFLAAFMTLIVIMKVYSTESSWTYCDHVIANSTQVSLGDSFCFNVFSKYNIDNIPQECQLRCRNYRILSGFNLTSLILLFPSLIALLISLCRYNRLMKQKQSTEDNNSYLYPERIYDDNN